ncbi:hypothetical protein [Blastococcus montanus]|uniref:hypothetical protein n=1 Tax=Blastococcus montanus TaxID=3144973 RepID=UPI003208815E
MRRRLGGAALAAVVLTGCSQSVQEDAHDRLQERLVSRHEHYLHTRSLDPYSTGRDALDRLDPYGYAVESTAEGGRIVLVEAIGVSVHRTSGFIPEYEDASVGACVRVTVETGEGGGDRGSVTSEPVQCPAGTDFGSAMWSDGHVDEVTTDLDGRSDDVEEPPYDPPVCISGELCTEGGG